MAKHELKYDPAPGGIYLYLTEQKRTLLLKQVSERLNVEKWDVCDDLHSLSGLAKLAALTEEHPDTASDEEKAVTVLPDGDGYFIPHAVVAEFTEAQALSLGLPSSVPFQLRIETNGPLLEPTTHIKARWYSSGRQVQVEKVGAILEVGPAHYRIPEPLFSSLDAIDQFNTADSKSVDDRLEALAGMSALFHGEARDIVHLEKTLKDLRISHATAFGLDLKPVSGGIDFDPLLFGQEVMEEAEATGEQISDSSHLLTEKQQERFANSLFKQSDKAKPSYVIERGTYLYIDPSLRPALEIVREQQQADATSRRNFAKNPAGYVKERLLGQNADDPELTEALEKLFVETTAFSDRVRELGLWMPKAIPWLQRQPNSWLPESFGLKIGDKFFKVDEKDLDHCLASVNQAITNQQPEAVFPDGTTVPASEDTRSALESLRAELQSRTTDDSAAGIQDEPEVPPEETDQKPLKHVLIVEENVEEVSYLKNYADRSTFSSPEIPQLLKNPPKPHQVEGIGWLQECWCKGFPGALLADDMGLGKTFQTLGFISWLQRKRQQLGLPRQPVLIVAPTSLLNNWLDEETMHLHEPGLGEPGLLFGKELKMFKDLKGSNDVKEGTNTLKLASLASFDWLLTTYETLRDYQISIGMLPLACVVFDEIQRVKTPKSLTTNASKSLNADFTLGLTGTPVENSLADLWCILDTLFPGLMGDLKSFMNDYPEDDHEALGKLRATLMDRAPETPAPMLRRLKLDILDDLPAKTQHVLDEPMQGYQAECYDTLIKQVKREEVAKGLKLLHHMRGISLHPHAPDSDASNEADNYIAESARLRTVFQVLDQVASKNEKVLIFVESLAMQEWLSFVIKQRYKLKRLPPRIYGETPATERKLLVDRFQERKGVFGVMLLSPKAGGVGLTITAATHVIHLSRWWNPAVEDQCTDRAYRIGQEREVNVYIPRAIHPLYGDGSFDAILHDLLERKRTLSRNMLIPMESKGDIDEFFSKL
ncbi:DEAD/DEAH box helicase [Marinobacterium sp. MBR-111]|uniref:DEAD/DEAH box helicase n=1 Tax=Marinobacterium sp. MBR-111 TaxID=3156463 RepID=UPI003397878A